MTHLVLPVALELKNMVIFSSSSALSIARSTAAVLLSELITDSSRIQLVPLRSLHLNHQYHYFYFSTAVKVTKCTYFQLEFLCDLQLKIHSN